MDHPDHAAAAPRGRAPSGGELAGLGVFLAAAVVLPLLTGAVLDSVIHTAPLLLFMHGRGESDGPLSLVKKWGPPRLIELGESFPYVVVSPDLYRWLDKQTASKNHELAGQ